MKLPEDYSRQVFLNCPFDKDYRRLFEAMVFTVFAIRCALEKVDSSETRIAKIERIIRESKFGIHDVSRVELDPENQLPRFNMPLELGLFLGAKFYGDKKQQSKECLILDTERYRYQKFISDLSGQDIKAHSNQEEKAVGAIRTWLGATVRPNDFPGQTELSRLYARFRSELPELLEKLKRTEDEMAYPDFVDMCMAWLTRISLSGTAATPPSTP
jgi:hypothetical protein